MAEPIVPEQEEIKEEVPVEEPLDPEVPVEEEATEPDSEAGAEGDDDPEPERKPSRRENLRIQKLVQQLRAKDEAKMPELPKTGLDYGKSLDADPEVVKQLEDDRNAYGKELYLQGVREANAVRFQTRLEVDAPRVEAKHPQLDKDSNDFHPALADAINSMYLSSVGYDQQTGHVQNPNIRYSDYVESIFELASEIAGQQTTQAKKNIARQVASTGLRPDGGTAKRMNLNKAPQDMTNEELEAVIGASMK